MAFLAGILSFSESDIVVEVKGSAEGVEGAGYSVVTIIDVTRRTRDDRDAKNHSYINVTKCKYLLYLGIFRLPNILGIS